MTALLLACILLAPSAPQTEIGEPLVVENTSSLDRSGGLETPERMDAPHGATAKGSSRDVDSSTAPPKPSSDFLPDTATIVEGKASWYCGAGSRCTKGYAASGLYAAAGPALRVGDWRGRTVTVRSGSRSVVVRLVDWCQCPDKVLDLYASQFQRLAPLSRGVIPVQVSWGEGAPATLPPTSTTR